MNTSKNKNKIFTAKICTAVALIVLFILWTILVKCVDVQDIGPDGSRVGFASLNQAFHELTGVNMTLYNITDLLGLVPIAIALCFAVSGLVQLIKRRSLWRVDGEILALGVFYIIVIAVFLFFEKAAINYRPVLIEGKLEASYPSSTTLLSICVLPTAMIKVRRSIKSRTARIAILCPLAVFCAFMVVVRTICGVHWLTDIIGGMLVGSGLVLMYSAACDKLEKKSKL